VLPDLAGIRFGHRRRGDIIALIVGLAFQVAFAVLRDGDDPVVVREPGEHDTHGVTTLGRHFGHGRAYHLAAGKNHKDLIVLLDDERPDEIAARLLQFRHLDAETAAALHPVLLDVRALG